MKLHYSATSPYVRKVMMVLHELGIADSPTLLTQAVAPTTSNDAVNADNPLGKVPVMVTDDGTALFDSAVICEYLATEYGGGTLLPASGPARWTARRLEALADGLLDAALLVRYETAVRPGPLHWSEWEDGQRAKMTRAIAAMEAQVKEFGSEPTLGTIAVACALGYLDFRFASDNWRSAAPRLAQWHNTFSKRQSYEATNPAE